MKRILARHNPGMDTRTSLPASCPGLEPAIRVSMLPRDTNSHGTIFGGVLLAYIDQAGDIVSFYTTVARIGRTSITIKVLVTAERWRKTDETVKVTEAEVVYVNVDEKRQPTPITRTDATRS